MSFDELKKTIAGIDWDAYMKDLGIQAPAELNVEQVEPIQEVARLMNTLPLSKHVSYLEYNLLDAAASCLSDDFVAAPFRFLWQGIVRTPGKSAALETCCKLSERYAG